MMDPSATLHTGPTVGWGTVARDQLPLVIGLSIASTILFCCTVVVRRLYFSPLSQFPGPFLAKISYIPEIYHDVWCQGLYVYEIEKMHARYGPIIRVNPHELSIHDPLFYDKLYVGAHVRKTDNYHRFVNGMDLDGSHFLTDSHELHKTRRKVLDPFFSRFGIRRLEPLLKSLVIRFEQNLKKHAGQIVRLDHAFVCFSGDVIRSITCEDITYFMDAENYSPEWFDMLITIVKAVPLVTAFPWLIQVVNLIPESVLNVLFPIGGEFVKFKNMARGHIIQAKRDKEIADEKHVEVSEGNSVFRSVINSKMPEAELGVERLTKEAQVLFGAGTATTARTLDFLAFYVIALPELRRRLAEELREPMAGFPDKFPTLVDLENLPLLHATVKEGLRLSFGVMHRLPHCYPDTTIRYKDWTIPPNTPVGMSAYLNHTDPSIFVDPLAFNPDRWLGDVDPRMEKAFVPFSKGSRGCLGMNLGATEVHFMLAALFRPDGPVMSLYQTDESDVKQLHDFMLPLPKLDTKGVRVLVH